jgi:hypothetical protein
MQNTKVYDAIFEAVLHFAAVILYYFDGHIFCFL